MATLTVRIDFGDDKLAKSVFLEHQEPSDWIDLCTRFVAKSTAIDASTVTLVISGEAGDIKKLKDSYSYGSTIFRCRKVLLPGWGEI